MRATAVVAALLAAAAPAALASSADETFSLMLFWNACECQSSKGPGGLTTYTCRAQATAQDSTAKISSDGSVDFTVTRDPDHGVASWRSVATEQSDGTFSETGNVTFGRASVGEAHTFTYHATSGAIKPSPGGDVMNTAGIMGKVTGGSGYFRGATGFYAYTEHFNKDFSTCEIYSSMSIVRSG